MEASQFGQTSQSTFLFSKLRWGFLENYSRLWMTLALLFFDFSSLALALRLAQWLTTLVKLPGEIDQNQIYLLLAGVLGLMFFRRGLYPGVGRNYIDELGQMVSSLSFTFLIVFVIIFILEHGPSDLRLLIGLTWLFSLGALPATRYLGRRALITLQLWGEPVAILGSENSTVASAAHFKLNLQLGLRPSVLINHPICPGCDPHQREPLAVCELKALVARYHLHTALVIIEDLNQLDEFVERYRPIFHRLILVKDKDGRHGLTTLEVLDFSEVFGLQVKNNLLGRSTQVMKRTIDVVGALFGLLTLSPLLGLCYLLIRLESPGDPFYRQTRLGLHGQPFQVLKFRSMIENAEQHLAGLLATNPDLQAEWETHQKLKKDPRLTRLGRILRKFSLDEFPQLWNVLLGEMSLVGPRPILPEQREVYGPTYADYIQTRPGMTGLWQVSGRNETTFTRRAALDYEYIQRWSLWLDIYILVKTVKVVFWQKGAF